MQTADPTPDTAVPEASTRSCATCGAGMEHHQDWCLECGTAAAGRLGGLRPGWRAVTTTLALTFVLVGGAGAASYAALSSDANRDALAASVPGDGTPVAQAPPAVPAPAAPVTPAPAGAPVVTPPSAALPKAPAPRPVSPAPSTTQTTAQVTPKDTTPKGSTSPSPESVPRSNSTAAGQRGSGTSADGTDSSSSATLTPITLAPGAIGVYDPYGRSVAPGDPAEAQDGSASTTFEVGAPSDGGELQVGIVVDLGSVKQVRGLQVTSTTPGGTIEVYATDSSRLPPDILDTRWDHPASRKAAGRNERIVFPKGGSGYRYVTLWLTKAPKSGRRFGLTELKVLK